MEVEKEEKCEDSGFDGRTPSAPPDLNDLNFIEAENAQEAERHVPFDKETPLNTFCPIWLPSTTTFF